MQPRNVFSLLVLLSSCFCLFSPHVSVSVTATKIFKTASWITTQAALDDAPDRYVTFIQDAINNINNMVIDSMSDGGSGCRRTKWSLDGSAAQKQVSIVPHTLKIVIADASTIVVTATLDIWVQVPASVKACVKILFWCTCDTLCRS